MRRRESGQLTADPPSARIDVLEPTGASLDQSSAERISRLRTERLAQVTS